MTPTCKNCIWWQPIDVIGVCRVFAPVALSTDTVYNQQLHVLVASPIWPKTWQADWCGKFEAKAGGGQ